MTSASLAAQSGGGGGVSAFLEALGTVPVLPPEAAADFLGAFPGATVVEPRSVGEVQAVIAAASLAGVTVAPAGAGSWLGAGGWTLGADVVLSTRGLDGIVHYEPADLTATVGAGLAWTSFQALLAEQGQWLPLDPPGVLDGTVGGVVASGVSGSLRGHFGATRDAVLGLEVVTGEGRRLEVGGRVVKNVAGYDLVRLLTGSRGSLGVITRVSVRLFPKSSADWTALFSGSLEEVVALARRAATAPMPIASIELQGLEESELAVRFLGGEKEVQDSSERLVTALGPPATTLRGDGSRLYHRNQTEWEKGAPFVVRLSLLPALLDRCVAAGARLAGAYGGQLSAHVTQGVVRVRFPSLSAETARGLADALDAARSQLEESGGGLLVSTAPPDLQEGLSFTGGLGSQAGVTDRVRKLFDPEDVLAPRCP